MSMQQSRKTTNDLHSIYTVFDVQIRIETGSGRSTGLCVRWSIESIQIGRERLQTEKADWLDTTVRWN